ncbi:MAG: isoprenyl transferase [Acidobacteriota bacterium]
MSRDRALVENLAEPGSPADLWLRRLDLARLPRHVAVIMDGNGRWARSRGKPRAFGHRSGVEAVRDVVEASACLGLEVLTLYAFSVENWQRPRHEVWTLMNLLRDYLRRDIERLINNGVRLRVLGRRDRLDPSLLTELDRAVERTAGGDRMELNVALNYSARCEIVDACRRLVQDWGAGQPLEIDEATIDRYLYTAGQPDPDLLIRTSGEMRISNFLLWQLAYTEIWVTEKMWPDFRRADLLESIHDFQKRRRRFGRVENEEPADALAVGASSVS